MLRRNEPPSRMEPLTSLIDTPAGLGSYLRAWDELAVAAGRPYCAPAWMLSWWRHAAPPGSSLRVVVLTERSGLVAVAPFFAQPTAIGPLYRLLAWPVGSHLEPLARAGREDDAARAFTQALAGAEPRPAGVAFDGSPRGSVWPDLFRRVWPGRAPLVVREASVVVPTVRLDGPTLDDYYASLSPKMRAELRRHRRQVERQGAQYRLAATVDELRRGLADFAHLHYGRWHGRGGSGALDPGIERMLDDAGRELLGDGRFRLFTIEIGGRTISAHVFVAAGGAVKYWLGGFDPAWSRYGPGNLMVAEAIADALGRGERSFDLGPGAQDYKRRLAHGEDVLDSVTLVTRRSRYPLARGLRAYRGAREGLSARVPESAKARLRGLRSRLGTRAG